MGPKLDSKDVFEKVVNLSHRDLVLCSLILAKILELVHVDSSSNILVSHFLNLFNSSPFISTLFQPSPLRHTMSFVIAPNQQVKTSISYSLTLCSESSCILIITLLLHMLFELTETSNLFILPFSSGQSSLPLLVLLLFI